MIELPDGTLIDEVEIVREQIEGMPTEGGIVTPERHSIELIGAKDKVLDLKPYLEHFESRVMAGLRLSDIDVGRGDTANRATAQTINKNLVDAVKDFQQVISDQLTCRLLDILILEGGFQLDEETRVYWTFPSPDREEMRAHQNHGLLLFQSNTITHEEYRTQYLHKDALDDNEWKDTHIERFDKPMAVIGGVGSSAETTSAKASTANKNQPENQQGKMSTKPAIAKNDSLYHEAMIGLWRSMKPRISVLDKDLGINKSIISEFQTTGIDLSKRYIHAAIDIGVRKARRQVNKPDLFLTNDRYESLILKTIRTDLTKIAKKFIILHNQTVCDEATLNGLFGSLETELTFLIQRHLKVAERFGFVEAAKLAGCTEIVIESIKDDEEVRIDADQFSFRDLFININDNLTIYANAESMELNKHE